MCSRANLQEAMFPEQRLELANRLQTQGKYQKAIEQYEKLLSEFPSQEIAEKARFELGRCQFQAGEYDKAVATFEQFIDSYGTGDLADNAIYMIAVCYMKQAPGPERDQTMTLRAVDELNLLLKEYPNSDVAADAKLALAECRSKLAEKEYLNGMLYLNLGYFESAVIYFDLVVKTYADTRWVAPSLLGKASSLIGLGRIEDATELLEQIIKEYPHGKEAKEAASRLNELNRGKRQGQASSRKD